MKITYDLFSKHSYKLGKFTSNEIFSTTTINIPHQFHYIELFKSGVRSFSHIMKGFKVLNEKVPLKDSLENFTHI